MEGELKIDAARCRAVLDEMRLVAKGLEHDDDATTILDAMRVQEPSGAASAGTPNARGFAETFGLLS
jgi:hypothetical protein